MLLQLHYDRTVPLQMKTKLILRRLWHSRGRLSLRIFFLIRAEELPEFALWNLWCDRIVSRSHARLPISMHVGTWQRIQLGRECKPERRETNNILHVYSFGVLSHDSAPAHSACRLAACICCAIFSAHTLVVASQCVYIIN